MLFFHLASFLVLYLKELYDQHIPRVWVKLLLIAADMIENVRERRFHE